MSSYRSLHTRLATQYLALPVLTHPSPVFAVRMLDDAIQQLQRTSDVTEDLLARVSHKYDVTLRARETLLLEKEKQLKGAVTGTAVVVGWGAAPWWLAGS